jgi:sulfonate transport system permease protein
MNVISDTAASAIVREAPRDENGERIHRRRMHRAERILAAGIPLLLIGLWQLSSSRELIDSTIYPSPVDIGRETWDLLADGRLRTDTWVTLRLILSGYLIGAAVGFLLGTAMGVSRLLRAAFEPLLNGLYVVPKLALLPIFLTIFGFGQAPKIVLISITVFFFVWIETMEAIVAVPIGHREAARSFSSSPFVMFRHVLLPATLPQIFTGLRIAMGVAVLVTIASEFVVGNQGLGYLIFNSRQLFQIKRTYVGIVWVALLGVALSSIVGWVGRRLTPWSVDHSRHRSG